MEDYTPVEYQHREDIQRKNGGKSPALGTDNINNKYKNKYKSKTSHISNYAFGKETHNRPLDNKNNYTQEQATASNNSIPES